jgi:hypothetical protein
MKQAIAISVVLCALVAFAQDTVPIRPQIYRTFVAARFYGPSGQAAASLWHGELVTSRVHCTAKHAQLFHGPLTLSGQPVAFEETWSCAGASLRLTGMAYYARGTAKGSSGVRYRVSQGLLSP